MNGETKSDSLTPQDFELFKKEIDNKFLEMKSDLALFKQGMENRLSSVQESITKDINNFIGRKLNILATVVFGILTVFIVSYATYFEWTHNSINKINQERASLELEKTILAVINKKFIDTSDNNTNLRKNPDPLNKTKGKKR